MWQESAEQASKLRTGLTTGTCATACAVAAARCLLSQPQSSRVSVTLPKGKTVELDVSVSQSANSVTASTIKDAGDDPDVTHGARVFVTMQLDPTPGIQFSADKGVGTVTRDGLALAVGEPAINPVPRAMIRDNLSYWAAQFEYSGGFRLSIGVEGGEQLALKTMNPRLGIEGGLSILGTSGIVRPFSCGAWIASIYQGIDVAYANGIQHIAATTGNSSEQAVQQHYQLDAMALIEMGDFAGAVLKHMRKVAIAKLTICGGFGKITKLANGHMDLNSRVSAIDFSQLASAASQHGADAELQQAVLQANTSIEAYKLCQQAGIDLALLMCRQAYQVARNIVPQTTALEIMAINRQGQIIAKTNDQSLGLN
ncbi:MAG: cobalt-precorrin-5B (C(1))-methyltransferase [Pseudomonadales bacterium]|nr:cobalt-precorrin-5B (C(1))-methyltransferase [Pseudomonadales bacterium]